MKTSITNFGGTLKLNSTNISSNLSNATGAGIAFDYGNLIIENAVQLLASTSAGYQSELGSGLNLEMSAGSELFIEGILWYIST